MLKKKRILIGIDDWKLGVFEKHLRLNGYSFEQGNGLTMGTIHLYVETDDVARLMDVVKLCQVKAAELKN